MKSAFGPRLVRLILLLFMVDVQQATAHTYPVARSPAPDVVLPRAPATASIRFSAVLEPVFSSLAIKNADGLVVVSGTVRGSNSKVIRAELPALAAGTYRVYWRAVSRDGHRVEGKYTFFVR